MHVLIQQAFLSADPVDEGSYMTCVAMLCLKRIPYAYGITLYS